MASGQGVSGKKDKDKDKEKDKEDDKRRQTILVDVLELKPVYMNHPTIASMVSKYAKMTTIPHADGVAFKLDLLRMLAVTRRRHLTQ